MKEERTKGERERGYLGWKRERRRRSGIPKAEGEESNRGSKREREEDS